MSITCSKAKRGSSRSVVITATSESRATCAISSSRSMRKPRTPGMVATACPNSSSGEGGGEATSVCVSASATEDGPCAANLFLQLHESVNQRFGGGRASRDIDVDRDYAVAAAHHRIGVVVIAAAVGAASHADHPARLWHLVVHLAQRGRHLVGQRAGDDHHVALPRRG